MIPSDIPTPRSDAAKKTEYHVSHGELEMFEYVPYETAQELERELTIARQVRHNRDEMFMKCIRSRDAELAAIKETAITNLRKLGYTDEQIKNLNRYFDAHPAPPQ